MSQANCKYHPEIRANWHCPDCAADFCHQCVEAGVDGEAPCPLCQAPMRSRGISRVAPLWQDISRFFRYPLHLPPLLLMLALTGLNLLAETGSLGFLLQMLLFVVFVKYACVVMSSMARGEMQPARLRVSLFTADLELPFKLLFVVFCYGLFNTLVGNHAGEAALNLSLLLSSFLFPASIMLLASRGRFLPAINPLAIAALIRRTGMAYAVLFVFLGLLLTGSLAVWKLLSLSVPPALLYPLMLLAMMYFLLVMFAMMGYVLYQYHESLGLAAGPPRASRAEPVGVDILLQEGRYAEATERLAENIELNPNDFSLRERLHRILCSIDDSRGLQKYSSDYVVRLLLMGKPSEAVRVFMECQQRLPDFKIQGARHRHEMARLLVGSGQSRAALGLLNDLHRDYPSYEGIPNAYLLVARIMFEYFSNEDKARRILQYLMQKYPNHPAREKVRSYLGVLDNIASQ